MSVLYKYKAIDETGRFVTGEMSAEQVSQVTEYLEEKQLQPVKVKKIKDSGTFSLLGFFKSIDYEDLILFTNNLATTYRAGIPIIRALTIIKIGPENSKFNKALFKMRHDVQAGKSLSQAMSAFPEIFSPVFINSISAGEESGKLDDILDELSEMLEKELEISRQIKAGLRYPIIILSVIAIAFVVLMTFVMPKFMNFYSSFNAELPLPTKIMIGMSNFILDYWWLLLTVIGLAVYTFRVMIKHPKSKLFLDRTALKLPVFGKLIIKGNVARFSLMFRILFKSGLPIVKSLMILTNSVKNSMISQEIGELLELFKRGSEHELIEKQFLFFPDMAKQMISLGLESGSLENMLYEVGNHYTKEVQYTSRHLTSILEPILTLFISVFVLLMALAIFLPMWNLIKVFNG